MVLPEAFTVLRTGQARSTGCQKQPLVLPHWAGQDDWVPEAFTCPVALDRPGRLGARSIHLSCRTGQARSTGCQKPSLVLPHWTGPDDWVPEASTCPAAQARTTGCQKLHLSCRTGQGRTTGCQKPSLVLPHWTGRTTTGCQKPPLVLPHWTGQVDWVPEAFTCPAALDRPGRLGARSLHLSCRTGQARSTGCQKPPLVLPHWTGQDDWVPEAFTCPAALDRPGRLGARSLHLSCRTGQARSTGCQKLHLSCRTGQAKTTGCQKPSLVLPHWTGQDDWVPEASTCPAALDRPGRLGARSLHLSCRTGQARSTGCQKPSLVLPHWTGQDDWVPEAFTCPAALDRPGRLDLCVQIARSLHSSQPLSAGQVDWTFLRLCLSSL